MQGNAISRYRKAARLTQAELAVACGTTRNMVHKLESGDRRLNNDWMEKIGGALHIAPWMLIAPEDVLPNADELETLIESARLTLPQGLPWPEWQRALAAELSIRLRTLAADRAHAD
jgi:transcriptional regulator with XRE-family HTH domain